MIAILVLSCTTLHLLKKYSTLKQHSADQAVTINSLETGVVQYKNKFGEVYTRSMNQVRSANELAASKDSTIASLLTKVWASNLKLDNVVTIGKTVTRIIRDTNIVYRQHTDTTYNLSEPPHLYEWITIKDSMLSRKLDVRDSIYTISHLKKEFVLPRKKFFISRWFQERQYVLYTDKLHTNPFVSTTSSMDITILGKDGKPKSTRSK